jgi:DNA-binding Lrp family transcriptional regulator
VTAARTQCVNLANIVGIMLRDEVDRQIVAYLVENGRATFAEVGERVGLSAPAAKRRVDRLLAQGTITAFTAVVDPEATGPTMEAFIELHCRGRTSPEALRAIAAAHPPVIAAYSVTGEADALLHLRCAGVDELEATLERIRDDERVVRTSTVIVLSRLLHRVI